MLSHAKETSVALAFSFRQVASAVLAESTERDRSVPSRQFPVRSWREAGAPMGAWLQARGGRDVRLKVGNRPLAGNARGAAFGLCYNQCLRDGWKTSSMHVGP